MVVIAVELTDPRRFRDIEFPNEVPVARLLFEDEVQSVRVRFPVLVHPSDDDLINSGFQNILAEAIDVFMCEDGFPEALQPRLHLALVTLPVVVIIELRLLRSSS